MASNDANFKLISMQSVILLGSGESGVQLC